MVEWFRYNEKYDVIIIIIVVINNYYSFSKYLWNVFCMVGFVLGNGDIVLKRCGIYILMWGK